MIHVGQVIEDRQGQKLTITNLQDGPSNPRAYRVALVGARGGQFTGSFDPVSGRVVCIRQVTA